MKKIFWRSILIVSMLCMLPFFTSGKVEAAPKKARKVSKWVESNQKMYYFGENGRKTVGLVEIKDKKYYFDKKGVQHYGWQRIKDDFYFFRIAKGKKGSMAASCKVNGITLKKNGKAKLTEASKAKLRALVYVQELVEKNTKPLMKKEEKLKLCFEMIKKYRYRGSPTFCYTKDWDQKYAMEMFEAGFGNCYHYGAAFAYLANAIGCNASAVSSGGHGWAEVDGKVYDPSWSLVDQKNDYFGVDIELSGKNGRPNYKGSHRYINKI